MIIDEKRTPITSTIDGEAAEFRIATNAKAFRVLVDGIYADKIGSIVRELLSNAFDAHVRAGRSDTPFEVRLPMALNPTFSVRDFGVSMPHEFVMSTYSTLFASDKSASNTEVGAFGLGAKSFLAYTDACTLTCWLDGEVRSYAIAINDGGVPEVRIVHRGPSDAPQGVEVTFAVSQSDFTKFVDAARACAVGFDVQPRFFGDQVTVQEPVHSGAEWRAYNRTLPISSCHVLVRQGCAVYPTNAWHFNAGLPHGWQLMIDVPIGEANVTASRESLALTSAQADGLRARMAAAVAELHEKVRAEYGTLVTDIERARFAEENLSLLGKGEWPTWVDTPCSLHQWDAGALAPRNRFAVRTMPKMLVLHDSGDPILRRTLRLRALVRRGFTVYIERDTAVIERVRRILDLADSQIMPLSSIPDVPVKRTPSSSGAKRTKKEVADDVVWAIATRNDASAGPFHWNRSTGHLGGHHSSTALWLSELIRTESGKPLLFLTPREAEQAVAKGKVDEIKRLDRVVASRLRRHLADYRLEMINRAIYGALHHRDMTLVLMESLGLQPNSRELPPIYLFEILLPEVYRLYTDEARSIVGGLSARYPLLFNRDTATMMAYVALCDSNTESAPVA